MMGVFVQLNEHGNGMSKKYPVGYVLEENGCWSWVGHLTHDGYGLYDESRRRGGGDVMAHRIVYKMFRGPIPPGLSLDHLCRNTKCVNPDHLEAVPIRVNILRGNNTAARHFRATHCKRGHPFGDARHKRTGSRICLPCKRIDMDVRNARKRAARAKRNVKS